jgi:hypothetical protein
MPDYRNPDPSQRKLLISATSPYRAANRLPDSGYFA